jgi:hypothetical protein
MGIELPAELADVATAAGVQWPQADEDAMRTSATAWRQAGTATSALAADADGTANQALSAVRGTAGAAAQQHWHTFVAPDTGHLTSTAKGCLDAADRLDHAADQIGAAKVQIVQHLVNLAKNTDAANHAAAAGHPTALAGLSTAVQGTAVNVAQVNHTLTNSIRLDHSASSPVGQAVGPVVGGHGLTPTIDPTGPLGHTVDHVVGPVAQVVAPSSAGQVLDPVAGAAGPHGPIAHTVDPLVGGPAGGPGLPNQPGLPNHPGLLNQPGLPNEPGLPNQPGLANQPGLVDQPGLSDRPIAQVPQLPGQHDPGSPILAGGGPVLGHAPVGPGVTVAQSAAPIAPPPPIAPAVGPSDLLLAGPTPPAHVAPTPAAFDVPATPSPTPTGPPPIAGPPPMAAPTNSPAPTRTPATSAAPTGTARGDDLLGPVAGPPPAGPTQRRSIAVPSPTPALPNASPAKRDDVALFLVYLFPIGRLPTVTTRPSRQLPPPPPDTDFAAGLRFPPHDHPDSHLIDDSHPPAGTDAHPGLAADEIAELAEGYDPLGGEQEHERDWDRRFLVRPATDDANAEYAWPPGELFPEGGCADGEPIVLPEGTVLDRFGTSEGRVFSADGTPFARRSLPPDHLAAGYHRYEVTADLPVWRTLSAPWFGQPGGGERYRAVYPAADLMALGYLMEITDGR